MAEENNQTQEPSRPEAQKKPEKPGKVEIPKNCAECKKPIGKIRYYRNMMFFCNKKCWGSFRKKEEAKKKPADEKQEQAQQLPA